MGGWGEVIGGPKGWARDLTLAVLVGVALGLVGPFGSYADPLERRILVSVSYGLAGSVALWPTVRLGLRAAARLGLPEWFGMIAALAVGAAPVTATSLVVGALFDPRHAAPDIGVRYLGVLAIVLPVGLAMLLFDRRAAVQAPPRLAAPRLLARVPAHLGKEILALQAEDHYVRVHTVCGSHLLLMRLSDAVAELDGLEGLRVHRSWWVARGAVTASRREGRRLALTLANGIVAPVTREAVPRLRQAGWV